MDENIAYHQTFLRKKCSILTDRKWCELALYITMKH